MATGHLSLVLCDGFGYRSALVFCEGKSIERGCLRCLILDILFSILDNLYFLQTEKSILKKHNYLPGVLIDRGFTTINKSLVSFT